MNEKKDPVLSARVDVVLLALITHLKLNPDPRFEVLLKANKEMWRSLLIATQIPEGYLEELDGQMVFLLEALKK